MKVSPTTSALGLTVLAMLAFAGNSLLCRLALRSTPIDAASFTALRIASGALVLWLFISWRGVTATGNWPSAGALFVYAAAFSLAYVSLPAATGALLLFGSVQLTMLGTGLARGERLDARQSVGLAIAVAGLIALLLPGAAAPSLPSALLMLLAGMAWAVYSLRGKRAGDATRATAGNFLRATPLALLLAGLMFPQLIWDMRGAAYAMTSGAITSGMGYIIWYAAVKRLPATTAASVQLSVPAITALGGVVFLGEPLGWALAACCAAILGGVALAARPSRPKS
ncbi:DMT family transporter [Polaromonas sp. JS666]|uniref:DMT family transporter n=1 Tax=Polaromonas sp. (strain JS666 / ATCC BAA-500) TaxID=296591 RepID=UPI0008921FA9|nr:DMT family transporter [Polaromonas sp. JS666]SDM36985.1 Threonine/homoserine efflux transporter RhtA [Polaromonas sp. JS666]